MYAEQQHVSTTFVHIWQQQQQLATIASTALASHTEPASITTATSQTSSVGGGQSAIIGRHRQRQQNMSCARWPTRDAANAFAAGFCVRAFFVCVLLCVRVAISIVVRRRASIHDLHSGPNM